MQKCHFRGLNLGLVYFHEDVMPPLLTLILRCTSVRTFDMHPPKPFAVFVKTVGRDMNLGVAFTGVWTISFDY